MRLKLYRAVTVKEAMALVRAELGPEALILSNRRTAEGVEVTAALEMADEEIAAEAPQAKCPVDFTFHGIPAPLASRLAAGELEAALAGLLQFGPLHLGASRRLLLAGLPGAGKTLSIAKLATRLVLSGVKPLVITADGRRAGAAEELAAYTRLLGLNLVVASTPATLARALGSAPAQSGAPVLIDTSGINPFEAGEVADLAELVHVADAMTALVMAAGQDSGETAEQAACFANLGVRHLLPTRLDLARRLGSVINTAVTSNLILTEASVGSSVTNALVEITPAFLADRLLQPAPGSPSAGLSAARHCSPVLPPRSSTHG